MIEWSISRLNNDKQKKMLFKNNLENQEKNQYIYILYHTIYSIFIGGFYTSSV